MPATRRRGITPRRRATDIDPHSVYEFVLFFRQFLSGGPAGNMAQPSRVSSRGDDETISSSHRPGNVILHNNVSSDQRVA